MSTRFSTKKVPAAAPFWVLAAFIVLVFLTGGGARADIQSLAILRPASALALGYALWGMRRADVKGWGILIAVAVAITLLVGLHLIPLPPALWHALPGRELAITIDKTAGLGSVWRPISLVPSETWNALFSLLTPAAALALMIRISPLERQHVLLVLIVLGVFGGLLGMMQAVGPNNGPLYLYRITNGTEAVGLFANRNHHAIYLACLFPMLAVFASMAGNSVEQVRFRSGVALGIGILLIPLLLVAGSRSGLALGIVGLVSAALLYKPPQTTAPAKRKVHRFNPRYVIAGVSVFGLTTLTILMSRANVIDRLFAQDAVSELRFAVWPRIVAMSTQYLPFGSGFGSFVEIYQVHEPMDLMTTEYLNHAHNDWVELFLTGGIPAILILLTVIVASARRGLFLFRLPAMSRLPLLFAKLGFFLMVMLALGSIGDYPLRAPSIAMLFVIVAAWFVAPQTAGMRTKVDPVAVSKSS